MSCSWYSAVFGGVLLIAVEFVGVMVGGGGCMAGGG